jgi:hypothetical protein
MRALLRRPSSRTRWSVTLLLGRLTNELTALFESVDALTARGVEPTRLSSAGYGSRCPADPACAGENAQESCRSPARYASDRRVVFLPLRVGTTSLAGEVVCARGADLIPASDEAFHAP